MEHLSRRIGRYDLTILHDGVFAAPADVMVHVAGEAARYATLAAWGKAAISVDVNCFLLRDGADLTLVDAGTGSSWGDAFGHARAALQALGVSPGQIGRILLTHLHGDHALGLFDGEEPYFPAARIGVPEAELAFFTDPVARESLPEARRSGFDIAARLERLYDGRIDSIDGEVMSGITLVPLPGHTPGHSGYLVQGEGESLLLWGDLLHVSDLQPGDPELGITYDLHPDTAALSRRSALAQAAQDGWIVAGGHVPGLQRVEPAGEGYRLVPA